MSNNSFEEMFECATEYKPFPYQKIAIKNDFPDMIRVPTGAGKTSTVVLAWLWKRLFSDSEVKRNTPRRLVYCLPMRVLVEQTVNEINNWIANLTKEYSSKSEDMPEVYTLMGGDADDDWDRYPEKNLILVGTQDMLISRALNRGYALSRFRWPIDFGLLNNDSLWILDEIQLMGATLPTSAQLDAFRQKFGTIGNNHTIWMSATCEPQWLETVDKKPIIEENIIELSEQDLENDIISKRIKAKKELKILEDGNEIPLQTISKKRTEDYVDTIKKTVLEEHDEGLTLVILNTVNRAKKLYSSLRKDIPDIDELRKRGEELEEKINDPDSWASKKKDGELYANDQKKLDKYYSELESIRDQLKENLPEIILLHSRFRYDDRQRLNNKVSKLSKEGTLPGGTILVTTQVVEAGVDISASRMITELAPWSSLVQRFGRLNRKGELEYSKAIVIDIDTDCSNAEDIALPYSPQELEEARNVLVEMKGVSIDEIESIDKSLPGEFHEVIRKKDVLELFDTTSDLTGNDIDVSKFIRDEKSRDVSVFWRDLEREELSDIKFPIRNELCSVPISSLNKYVKKSNHTAYQWDHLEGEWMVSSSPVPGQYILIDSKQGGYSPKEGWSPDSKENVIPVHRSDENTTRPETGTDDHVIKRNWETLIEHTEKVIDILNENIGDLPALDEYSDVLKKAALFHDIGKAHPSWQEPIKELGKQGTNEIWAKSGSDEKLRYKRKYLRHELSSALQINLNPKLLDDIDPEHRDLLIYLVAAHHGKVRLSIRSLPKEDIPWESDDGYPSGTRFARGIWEGDVVPEVELPGGITVPKTELNLALMGMGITEDGTIPWIERMINIRDKFGPFVIGYLESILRTADWKGSSIDEGGK